MADAKKFAAQHNGMITWTYKQSGLGSLWYTARDPATLFGVCGGLSAYWIKYHAEGGSLAARLGGGNLGSVDQATMNDVIRLYKSTLGDDVRTRQWLATQGMRPVQRSFTRSKGVGFIRGGREDLRIGSTSNGMGDPNVGWEIRTHGLTRIRNGYGYLTFKGEQFGKRFGHAVAMWVGYDLNNGPADAVFFDPNHGEFWFERKENFFFFFDRFYRNFYMTGLLKFDKGWNLQIFSK